MISFRKLGEVASTVEVLCVGDVMLDHFFSGSVSRISPEAPIPILKVSERKSMLGGAANTAANVSSLGCDVRVVSSVGEDGAGQVIRDLFASQANANVAFVEDPRGTIVKSRYSAMGQQLLRIDVEDDAPLPPDLHKELARLAVSAVPHSQAVILSDYNKGVMTPFLCQEVINAAQTLGIPVVVDPKGADYSPYRGATVITPNEKELSIVVGRQLNNDADVVAQAMHLARRFEFQYVCVTRGEKGAVLVAPHTLIDHLRSDAREVYDVSGAGDTFVAALACALAGGVDTSEAARYANVAAGVAVGKSGTATVTHDEIIRALENGASSKGHVHVAHNIASAKTFMDHWKSENLRVGLAHGSFDLCDSLHLKSLEEVKGECDRLVVAIDSDPIASDEGRNHAWPQDLSSLQMIDLVLLANGAGPGKLVDALLPDCFVEGDTPPEPVQRAICGT